MSLRSALMGLTNAGKNGKNGFISVKSSVVGKLISALMGLISALMSLISAGKKCSVFISGIEIRGRLETTGSHTSHIFSATPVNQATGLQARQGDAVLEREKESSESLFIQHFAFLKYTTVIAHRDIKIIINDFSLCLSRGCVLHALFQC